MANVGKQKLCGAKSKHSGKPCRQPAMRNGRCRFHGGKSHPGGPTHPRATAGGKYSKHMPSGLVEKYQTALADPDLANLRDELAALEALIAERFERIGQSASNDWWKRLEQTANDLSAASRDGNADQVQALVAEQQRMIRSGGDLGRLIDEIAVLIERKSRVADKEWKRVVAMNQVLTIQSALTFIEAMTEAISRHVTDRNTIRLVATEFARLVGPAGNGQAE